MEDYNSVYKDLLERGINERESGDVDLAVDLLVDAVKIATYGEQKAHARNHLGLAYFHKKQYEFARLEWIAANNISKVCYVPTEEATSLRNLSRHQLYYNEKGELNKTQLECALQGALKALQMAKEQKREDLVWFIHGLFSANKALGIKKGQRKLVRQEARALLKVWGKVDKLKRNVWAGGLIMDIAIVTGKVSIFFLKIARDLSDKKNLKRRVDQINLLLEELS
jgi:tetratricopeptide (TPR) repeat protein